MAHFQQKHPPEESGGGQRVRRDFFFRFPTTQPILLQGITDPSFVMVTPEKPALQPDLQPDSINGCLAASALPLSYLISCDGKPPALDQ